MNPTSSALNELFNKVPRRHSLENVKEINGILAEYETLLIGIEGLNSFYEKNTPVFFDDLEAVKAKIKKSTDNKISKKGKDSFFDEASTELKDSMQALIDLYADGKNG
ncbi:MAG: hypothetical protein JWP81_553 [Ferruginibacter sp.]|nr:hypothetical protein [Ferruginibacter sp.]